MRANAYGAAGASPAAAAARRAHTMTLKRGAHAVGSDEGAPSRFDLAGARRVGVHQPRGAFTMNTEAAEELRLRHRPVDPEPASCSTLASS